MYRLLTCLATEHDYRLVLLAVMICAASVLTSLRTYRCALNTRRRRRWSWLILSGVCGAFGIWATHFVAMLAYQPQLPIGYSLWLTAGSLLVAALMATGGFAIASLGRRWDPAMGGGCIGVGIGAMHFTGMAAIEVGGHVTWSLPMAGVALVGGIALTMAALVMFHKVERRRGLLLAAGLLVLAINSLHFIAMAAATIVPDPGVELGASQFDRTALAIAIAAVTALVLFAGGGAIAVDKLNDQLKKGTALLRCEVEQRREAEQEAETRRALLARQ